MPRTRVLPFLLLFIASTAFADASLPEMFRQAKEEFTRGNYKLSLAQFDKIDFESRKPGFENDRRQLVPVIAFYRGANLVALGRRDEARKQFVSYLGYMPNASITSPPYSRATVDVFQLARQDAASMTATMAMAYTSFVPSREWSLPADEAWPSSPVRYLLSSAEKKEYAALQTASDRETFVANFWRSLDPTPDTEENEFRHEFERRVAFADMNLGTDRLRGRNSEQGAVFAIFGPPTFITRAPLAAGDDPMEHLRRSGNATNIAIANARTANSPTAVPVPTGSMTRLPGRSLEQDLSRGDREAWVYRPADVPDGVQFQEVQFDFISKQGYGMQVLQKDPEPMQALSQAAAAARRQKRLD